MFLNNQIILLNYCILQKGKKTNKKRPEVKMGPFAGSYKAISEQGPWSTSASAPKRVGL